MSLPPKKNLLKDVPVSRWQEDVELLRGVAQTLRGEAEAVDQSPASEDAEIANALYQEAYACDRAAALLTAIINPASPERATLAQMLALFPASPKAK